MSKKTLLRIGFVVVLTCLFAFYLSGCDMLNEFQNWKNGIINEETSTETSTETSAENSSEKLENKEGAEGKGNPQNAKDTIVKIEEENKNSDKNIEKNPSRNSSLNNEDSRENPKNFATKEVSLFFKDPKSNYLIEEKREIPASEGIGKATINALLAGPSTKENGEKLIPNGTKLKDINIKENGECIVDFSREIADFKGNSREESLMVYSIVNTLAQFSTVENVQIWVDGKFQETLAGNVNIAEALAYSGEFVK